MVTETRRKILRYGIAIDLVVLATGFGFFFPSAGNLLLLALYVAASAVSAWKGGWAGGLTAVVASVIAQLWLFDKVLTLSQVAASAAASLVVCAIVRAMLAPARRSALTMSATGGATMPLSIQDEERIAVGEPMSAPNVVAFDRPAPRPVLVIDEAAEREAARGAAEERIAQIRRDAEARVDAEREKARKRSEDAIAAIEREVESLIARHRQWSEEETDAAVRSIEQAANERLAAARLEQEARVAVELEGIAREMDERVAAAREEAERNNEERLAALRRDMEARLEAETKRLEVISESDLLAEVDRRVAAFRDLEESRAAEQIAAVRRETELRIDAERETLAAAADAELRAEMERRFAIARQVADQDVDDQIAMLRRETEERVRSEEERLAGELEGRVRAGLDERIAVARDAAEREAAEQLAAIEQRIAAAREEIDRRAEEQIALIRRDAEARFEAERVAAERQAAEKDYAEQVAAVRREAAERVQLEVQRLADEHESHVRAELDREVAKRDREVEQRVAASRGEIEARVQAEQFAETQRLLAAAREQAEQDAAEQLDAIRRQAMERVDAEQQRLAEEFDAEVRRGLPARLAAAREEIDRELEDAVAAERQRLAAEVTKAAEERIAEIRHRAAERVAAESALHEAMEQRIAVAREEAGRNADEKIAELCREAASRIDVEHQRQAAEHAAAVFAEHEQNIAAARAEANAKAEAEIAAIHRAAEARVAAARQESEQRVAQPPAEENRLDDSASRRAASSASRSNSGILDAISGWFGRSEGRHANLPARRAPGSGTGTRRSISGNTTATRRAQVRGDRQPRILMLEKRRGGADAVVPKLRQKRIEVEVVERWIDAVDEIFRFKPDALFLDTELPDFERVYQSIAEHNPKLPIFLTGKSTYGGYNGPPGVQYAAFVPRPYDADHLTRTAIDAMEAPDRLLATQMNRGAVTKTPAPGAGPSPALRAPSPAAAGEGQTVSVTLPVTGEGGRRAGEGAPTQRRAEGYEVICYTCRVAFDAMESDWCSCLSKERTLICTNCLTCFCKAPPAFKEKFWVEAPPRLFERKSAEARRQMVALPANPPPDEVRRPLVLAVEDDDEIQIIVSRVCQNLGYGFVHASNGQDGLHVARLYRPNLILSDAFMPKLDGREMCRILKLEEGGPETKMVVMTGLYTDTKYRSEAVKRFLIDDYVAKPLAVTDLINLLQKHLEGLTDVPPIEDLHEVHRQQAEDAALAEEMSEEMNDGVALQDLLVAEQKAEEAAARGERPPPPVAPARRERKPDAYEVSCFNCNQLFDATQSEWCSCLGRDNTLVCEHCSQCFCKAPSVYKERFWIDAPPSLFERKMIGSKRSLGARQNPSPTDVKRPMILLVEDDENIQLIVRTVVTTMGYGFVVGANGQEGLSLAREYTPDLILSDAFMPKLDGREMCRLLKEDPATARVKAIIMTGLYTDRKYRNEALDYFRVDDYVAKPLAVDDLIKLFKKHLPQEVSPAM
jgi:CheY-like chemotaxis protein